MGGGLGGGRFWGGAFIGGGRLLEDLLYVGATLELPTFQALSSNISVYHI